MAPSLKYTYYTHCLRHDSFPNYKLCVHFYLAFLSGVIQAKIWRPILYLAIVDLDKGIMKKKHVTLLEKSLGSWVYPIKAGSRSSKEWRKNKWILNFIIGGSCSVQKLWSIPMLILNSSYCHKESKCWEIQYSEYISVECETQCICQKGIRTKTIRSGVE